MAKQLDIPDPVRVGLKFTSTTFMAKAEIVAIRQDANQLDVRLSDGDLGYIEKGWNLQVFKICFERGDYTEIKPGKEYQISVI